VWFDQAMRRTIDSPPSVNRARAFTRWAETAMAVGDYAAARERFRTALAIGEAIADPVRVGSALIGLGEVCLAAGDIAGARAAARRSLPEFRRAGDRERGRWALDLLALAALAESDVEQARVLLERSLAEARTLGNEAGIAETSIHLARTAHAGADLASARARAEEGLGLARRLGDRPTEAAARLARCEVDLASGHAARALDGVRSVARHADRLGSRKTVVDALAAAAAAHVSLGWFHTGVRLFGAATAHRERLTLAAAGPEATRHDALHERARRVLGEERYATEWGRGRALSVDEAIELADQTDLGPAAIEDAHAEPAEPAAPVRPAGPGTTPEQSLARDGDVWRIAYAGRVINLRDSKGLRLLAILLSRPGSEFHALDLVSPTRTETPGTDTMIDARARSEYRRRVGELLDLVARADASGDRTAAAREELEFIQHQLAAAYGLGGRPRRLADPAERARKAVTNRIRDAVSRIASNHSDLGRHLQVSVRTGMYCSYRPERAVSWRISGLRDTRDRRHGQSEG
jgi:tetratricopeptide (TPR) repeat protein